MYLVSKEGRRGSLS